MEETSKPPFTLLNLLKILLLFFFILFSLFPFHPICYALDEGGGLTSIESRTINRETQTTDTHQYEMNYHLDAWQNLPNVGKILLWLDWTHGKNDKNTNRLGRGYLALREFRFNDYKLNGLVGDTSIVFTNFSDKFSNSAYPDIYYRGYQTDIISPRATAQVFGGQVARLEGLLGKISNPTDEKFYGFKGNFQPIPKLLLGTGFIRTQDEVDNEEKPITKHNNIFLFDSEFQTFQWMKWLTEFRLSDYKGEIGIQDQRDYILRFGPLLKTERFKLEANYRRIGTDFRSVNQATQGESDQEGFFLLTEYKPLKELTLFGNADYYNDNVSDKSDRNTTKNIRSLIGLSFFSPNYPSFYLNFDINDRKTRFDTPSPVDNFTSTLLSEVRYQYKNLSPFVRYRRVDYKDEINPVDEYKQDVITFGIRQNFKLGTMIFFEGETDRKRYPNGDREGNISGKMGLNYYPSYKLSFYGETIFSKLKDRAEDTRRDKIEGALGLSAQLPWNIQLYADCRYDKILNPQRDQLKSEGIQANLRITKRLSWGKREKVAGLRPGLETKGFGTIEGIVFNDINRNGIQDKGEEGIKDVTIRLEDGSTVKTDERGYYQFSRVEVGTHWVTLDVKKIPADYNIISPEKVKFEIRLRETLKINYQLITAGRIEGRVINDADSNGKFDPTEKGIPDVLVLLEPGVNNSYTDEEGNFIFENIVPGEYLLKLDQATLPEDSIFTSPEELKFEVPVGGELKDMNFLIHIKPRPIIIGPPKK